MLVMSGRVSSSWMTAAALIASSDKGGIVCASCARAVMCIPGPFLSSLDSGLLLGLVWLSAIMVSARTCVSCSTEKSGS